MSGLLPDWNSDDIAGSEPPYRFLIANRLKEITGADNPGALEISPAARVTALKGASWRVCLKTNAKPGEMPLLPRYYAVFIQRDQVVDNRLSVLIDQCEMQTYAPFDFTADASRPPAR